MNLPNPMITPRKFLGQHFLHDENIARKIIQHLAIHDGETWLEIGPGQGMLTKYLIGQAAQTIAIELDERSVQLLQQQFGASLTLIHADVLSVQLNDLTRTHPGPLRVVGNIPYYITSEIVFWLFDQHEFVADATLMMQLEVARRFVAATHTKEYGILTVFANFFAEPSLLFPVTRNSFYPRPNVESAVIRLKFREHLPACNVALFRNVVRSTFGKRRKTLRNGLRYMGYPDDLLHALKFDLGQRPEQLTVDDFLHLTMLLESEAQRRSEHGVTPLFIK
ncbi:MAG: 16S rRNA (adenine(1518)-N(6)/adenine(1519)-N(6))-dimethyltransferase RsmA [bacterium]